MLIDADGALILNMSQWIEGVYVNGSLQETEFMPKGISVPSQAMLFYQQP